MRTQGIFYSGSGTVYDCELDRCPKCNGLMRVAYTSKYKTVQSMEEVAMIAQRTKRCANLNCVLSSKIWGSVKWGQIAPISCTYGYDVIAQIGWQRQRMQQTFTSIHTDLRRCLRISESQVRALYHYRYLPLLACHERAQLDRLKIVADQVGLLLSLDGLAPEGGEPQLWLVRELLSGVTLRCGWMSQQNQAAFIHFLQPIADLGLRVTAVMSDKQSGLLPAVAEVFPQSRHAFCQSHYLRNIAIPVAEADEAMKVRLRQNVRETIGQHIRQEDALEEGGLTITGVIPSPLEVPTKISDPVFSETGELLRDSILRDISRRIRYLLTLKGRPPLRLAGIEMFSGLSEIKECLERLMTHHSTPQLRILHEGLQRSLQSTKATYSILREAADWMEKIATILDPEHTPGRSGEQVRQELFAYLAKVQTSRFRDPMLRNSFRCILKTTRNYAPGLFHSYDIPNLPRTNNERENDFRALRRRLLRTTGQKGLSLRIIQRQGAWELLPRPNTLKEAIRIVSHIQQDTFQKERIRMRQHRSRFRLHTRSTRLAKYQLEKLEQLWTSIPDESS